MIAVSERLQQRLGDPAQAARALLGDHLEAALAHCEALQSASILLGASLSTGATGRELLSQHCAVTLFVRELKTRELAIGLRLIQARAVAAATAKNDPACRPLALLVRSGSALLVEAAADTGRRISHDLADTSDLAYLASRGLVPAMTVALSSAETLTLDDAFLVFGLTPLSEVIAFLNRALDGLELVAPMSSLHHPRS